VFLAPATGGLATKLPVPYGEFGSFSADGRTIAYMPQSQDFRTWKRYRGGWASEIVMFNLRDSSSATPVTSDANDAHPMMHGTTLYFMSDRGANKRYNLWALDQGTGAPRQVTDFSDFDITFPAMDSEDIVFRPAGGSPPEPRQPAGPRSAGHRRDGPGHGEAAERAGVGLIRWAAHLTGSAPCSGARASCSRCRPARAILNLSRSSGAAGVRDVVAGRQTSPTERPQRV
jgi:hypothetical protein